MKRYHVGDRTVAIIDGDLYEKLLPLVNLQDLATEPVRRKRHRPSPSPMPLAHEIGATMERKRRKHLDADTEQTIRADIAAGAGMTEVCRNYEISVGTFYRLKNEARSKPVIES